MTFPHKNLVEEVPLAITFGGLSFSVVLVSPNDIEDFILGYLFTQLVITQCHDVHDISFDRQGDAIVADVTLANRRFESFKHKQRQLVSASGCGICGAAALSEAFPVLDALSPKISIDIEQVANVKPQLRNWQNMNKESGALHAAFWLDEHLNILHCSEDIGRHNALDKLIGYLLRNKIDRSLGCILLTSRCSVELVQKTIISGVPSLISLASPSELAVKTAKKNQLQLIHIPKYDHPYALSGVENVRS